MSRHLRAVCLYDFAARQRDELSVSRNDQVIVQSGPDTTENWWIVQLGPNSGLVPCNYLQILPRDSYIKSEGSKEECMRDSLNTAPSDEWLTAYDESGDVYYYNVKTGTMYDLQCMTPSVADVCILITQANRNGNYHLLINILFTTSPFVPQQKM